MRGLQRRAAIGLRAGCLLAATVWAGTPVSAQQQQLTAAEIGQIKADVAAAVETYVLVFSERNAKAVIDGSYNKPAFSINAAGVTPLVPEKQIVQLEATMKRQQGEGWARSDIRNPTVCVMNRNAALASGNLYRFKADGSEHLINSETILFARSGEGWKIVSIMVHEKPDQGVACKN
jgi:hypothetical protein